MSIAGKAAAVSSPGASSRRRGFSLLELAVTSFILAILTTTVVTFLDDEPAKALVVRARAELQQFQTALQRRALQTSSLSVGSLAEALGVADPPVDPWENPYRLEGARQASPDQRLLSMQVVSWGPDGFADGDTSAPYDVPDDLSVPVKLPNPAYFVCRTEGVTAPTSPPSAFRAEVSYRNLVLQLHDWDGIAGDRVDVQLNGLALATNVLLVGPPGLPLQVTLRPGENVVLITARGGGANLPCTPAVTLAGPARPSLRYRLEDGHSAQLRFRFNAP